LIRTVEPSGADRATRSLASVLPPPTTFSIMTVWPSVPRHPLADQTRDGIRAAAGRKGDHQRHRLGVDCA
jgi:hypothetical protein